MFCFGDFFLLLSQPLPNQIESSARQRLLNTMLFVLTMLAKSYLQVNIGLRQGSALSPLRFILVMELISRKISTTDALRKILYADDLVIVAENREELQGALEEWNDMFKKHGLKMNLDKTEVMWIGKQREELNIRLEEKDIKQVKNFVYLGGNISQNGHVGGNGGSTQNTNRSECMEKRRGGNGGQKDFQKTEGEGPGLLCGAS